MQYDLFRLIAELNNYNMDYFIIFAHVDQKSGLFNECDGGMITSLFNNQELKEKTFGFQKSHSHDNYNNFKQWTTMDLPRIEGSDPKSLNDIGKGNKKTYIKIGDYSFNSIKYAFLDYCNRISDSNAENIKKHGYISSMYIEGGKFDQKEIMFSNEMNNIIGIRGSGKSAILEILRDTLGLSSDVDSDYKNKLVKFYTGSGGKVTLNVVDKYGKKHKIKKFFSENKTYIEDENGKNEDISINSIIHNPLYFGQKDLSMRVDGYEMKLLEKLVGQGDILNKEIFNNTNKTIEKDFRELKSLYEIPEKIEEQRKQKNSIESQLKLFKEKGIDNRLEKIQEYNNDKNCINLAITKSKELLETISTTAKQIDLNFDPFEKYGSKYNTEILKELKVSMSNISQQVATLNTIQENIAREIETLTITNSKFDEIKSGFEEEFEKIKREFNGDLNADTYLILTSSQSKLEDSIKSLETKKDTMNSIREKLITNIKERRELILKNNSLYEKKISKINEGQNNINISFIPNGNKEKFSADLKYILKGSGIRTETINKLSEHFIDYVGILEDLYINNSNILNTIIKPVEIVKINEVLSDKLYEVCEYLPNDNVEIEYHGKLLENHSLGQRASAILLFILAQIENDLIIIDQPEDDLDNKVIYDELIKTIKEKKKDIQFIFSTHNPNIPVLGDAEQIISIKDSGNSSINNASIDNSNIQNEIVEIMEGGEEAFNRRKKIYKEWKI